MRVPIWTPSAPSAGSESSAATGSSPAVEALKSAPRSAPPRRDIASEWLARLRGCRETVRAARANVERQQVFANAVAALVKNQLRPGADDSRAQAELAQARIQVIQAEQAEQIARANLAQWLGVRPATVQIAGDPLLQAPPPEPAVSPAVAAHPVAEAQMATVEASVALQHVLAPPYAAYLAGGLGVFHRSATSEKVFYRNEDTTKDRREIHALYQRHFLLDDLF